MNNRVKLMEFNYPSDVVGRTVILMIGRREMVCLYEGLIKNSRYALYEVGKYISSFDVGDYKEFKDEIVLENKGE